MGIHFEKLLALNPTGKIFSIFDLIYKFILAVQLINSYPAREVLTAAFPFHRDPVAVLGMAGPGAEIICGALVCKSPSAFKCFPVISYQLFLRRGALSGLSKARDLGPCPRKPPLPRSRVCPKRMLGIQVCSRKSCTSAVQLVMYKLEFYILFKILP